MFTPLEIQWVILRHPHSVVQNGWSKIFLYQMTRIQIYLTKCIFGMLRAWHHYKM